MFLIFKLLFVLADKETRQDYKAIHENLFM